jgi:hypothetical protein
MHDVLRMLIPVMGVSIPLVVVVGAFIVQPIVRAVSRMSDARSAVPALGPLEQRLQATEERLALMERQMGRMLEEQEFQRNLLSSRPGTRSMADAG